MRTGLIGRKLGMTRVLTEKGEHIPVTLIQIADCEVVNVKTTEKNGYNAVQVGIENQKVSRITKPLRGYFAKQKIAPKKKLVEFRVEEKGLLEVGSKISVEHFIKGQFVDVSALSIGKGFAGVMKRYNFRGLRASHGVSISHRSQGSTGQRQDPGKVFKGKKMAGHMGDKRVTIQNLLVIDTDTADHIIAIKGAIPGANGSFVEIRDAIKKQPTVELPFPAKLMSDKAPAKPVEEKVTSPEVEVSVETAEVSQIEATPTEDATNKTE